MTGDAPPILGVDCGRCRRRMASATLDGSGNLIVLASVSGEGEGGSGRGTVNGKGARRAARWWDHSSSGWNPDVAPTRYGYDCGGKHRGAGGTVTLGRLTKLYHEAVGHGGSAIYL